MLQPADQGPLYVETQLGRFPVEPFNTYSNLIFLAILIYWAWRTRLNFKRHPITVVSLPILLVGWIGGTIYHATRGHDLWRILDAGPIAGLALLGSVFLWQLLLGSTLRAVVVLVVPALLFKCVDLLQIGSQAVMIAIGYAFLSAVVIVPALAHCRRSKWCGINWLIAAAGCFAIAITMRQLDSASARFLPMGSHFLWHIFGGAAAFFAMLYLFDAEIRHAEHGEKKEDKPQISQIAQI